MSTKEFLTSMFLALIIFFTAYGVGYYGGKEVATEQLTAIELVPVTLTSCVYNLERALDFMRVEDKDYHEYEAMTQQWRALIEAESR